MNVVWIIADTFRLDAMGAYGNKKIRTPSLDSLAAKSMRFNHHYAASLFTMPARADFVTGRWTLSFMQWEPLPQKEKTLAQMLSKEKIHTAGIVDTPFYLRKGMGYDRGFRTFYEIPGQRIYGPDQGMEERNKWRYESDRFAPQTFITSMQWLERHYKEDFFLYIDTWDPHEYWDAPNYYTELYMPDYDGEIIDPPYARLENIPGFTQEKVKKAYATYWGEVTMVDTWIGHFLTKLENMNLMEKTAIIFTTDHGFNFGEHGLFGKSIRTGGQPKFYQPGEVQTDWDYSPLDENIVAIPLLICVPGIKPGTYNALTSAVDLMPTVLDIMGEEIPKFVEGKSLLPMVKDPSVAGRKFVISGIPFANPGTNVSQVDGVMRRMAKSSSVVVTTDDGWSLIYATEKGLSELYNIKSDPKQNKNVISKHPKKAYELHQILINFMKDTKVKKDVMEPRLELKI